MGKLKRTSKLAQRRQKDKQLQKNGSSTGKGHPHHKRDRNDVKEMQKVAPLMTNLTSSSQNARSMAVNSITLLCDNDAELRKIFLKNDLVKIILTKLLHDTNDDIVVDSYGLLRNLMIDEGYSLCMHLWRSDLWTLLESSFKKAIESLPHLNDDKVTKVGKELLVNFIDNLIGCCDSLCSELPLKLFEDTILEKLQECGILKFIFELVKQKPNGRLLLNSLEFLYDLATISYKFISVIANDGDDIGVLNDISDVSNVGKLSRAYLIGILLQVMEYKEEVSDRRKLVDQILIPLSQIYEKDINLKATVDQLNLSYKSNPTAEESRQLGLAKDNFNTLDLILDLYSSVIEMVGENYESGKADPAADFFNNQLKQFLFDMIESNFKDDKVLTCLNNLCIFDASNHLVDQKLLQFLDQVQQLLSEKFTQLLDSTDISNESLEEVNQLLNFYNSFTDMEDVSRWNVNADQMAKLTQLSGVISSKVEAGDVDALNFLQFNQFLIMYIGKISKNCDDLEITKGIVKFLVDEKFLKYLTLYGTFKNAEQLHNKLGYLIEDTLNLAINAIFDVFDDDYSYNRPIFHEGGLLQVLKDHKDELKRVYKYIDKNVNPQVKKRTQETMENLVRFIEYKETEL
ncbi:hypothetical protein FOA43_004781 [Brettanomyces nanus]|uniref:SYO1-like TPR repeats domain-containing protein n=1 Tax=Eeniella nana TaxID=13502 RepID=A0A875S912_EENNA|nr:uncharacterized protein FOA43_004781 [Brettanomyces nanus]QPG77368.1 hypothetical protein FOA43_004781 [Brettanomyces nanus]